MNLIFTYIPAAAAALLICLSSSCGQSTFSHTEDVPSSERISGNRKLSEFERSFQSALAFPGQMRFSAVPGASGYALFSGIEFSLLQGQAPWIRNQIKSMDLIETSRLRTFTSNIGQEIAQAIETERPPSRINFQETAEPDGSVPSPQTHSAADDSGHATKNDSKALTEKKYSSPIRGRVVLAKGLQVSGWKPASKGHSDVQSQLKASDPSAILPPPAPASDLP